MLGLTGLASSLFILGPDQVLRPWGLFGSPYGSFLAWKVIVVGFMVGLAGINRFVFLGSRPGPDQGPLARTYRALHPAGVEKGRAFSRAVAAEGTLGVVVLVLAGFLTAISPPSASETPDEGVQATGYGAAHNVTIRFLPAPAEGVASNVTLRIEDAQTGRPLESAVRVRVTFVKTGGNETGGESYPAQTLGGGKWVVGDVFFAQAGSFEARVEIQTETVYRDEVVVAFAVADPGER